MSWVKWQRFIRSIPARLDGSHVSADPDQPTRLSSWAQFPADQRLARRIQAQRDLIGEREIVADRKLIVENPDYPEQRTWPVDGNGSPIDDEFCGPIG